MPIVEAKRESRRLIGDHILTQNEVQQAVLFPDRIAHGGWPLDVHHPLGIYSGMASPFDCNPRVPVYSIPFRCLYSTNIANLLFAGRDVSVTHIALGSVRVQGTLSALGQAVGTAAALCLRHNLTPRQLGRERISELQQLLLKDDQYIPGIANEDPRDLAHRAKLSASSTATQIEFTAEDMRRETGHPLNMPRAVMLPRGQRERLEAISVFLVSQRSQPVELTLHLREADAPGDFSAATDLMTVTATVRPNHIGFVQFPIKRELHKPFYWVWLPKTDGLNWSLMQKAPPGAGRAYGGTSSKPWTVVGNSYYAVMPTPAVALPTDYRVENLVNGIARPVEKASNLWASDPAEEMPQWVELDFAKPTRFSSVYLTFDTDLNERSHFTPIVADCVRDYTLTCLDGSQWKELAAVKGNFQRRQVHRFAPVQAAILRVNIQATNGAKSARLFEVRVYDE